MNTLLRGLVRAAAEAFDLPGPILEIGAYQVDGQQAVADLRPLFPGRDFVGLDVRPGAGVDLVGDVEELPHADASVGTVLALETFEHVRRFWRGFEEIRRVLRPDGVLLTASPFYFHLHAFPSDYWRFTPDALRMLLEPYPSKIVGWFGPMRRPVNVWSLAFGERRPPLTTEQHARFEALLRQYARMPLPWPRRLRYQLGRLLSGSRPFAPYLDREQCQTEGHEAPRTFAAVDAPALRRPRRAAVVAEGSAFKAGQPWTPPAGDLAPHAPARQRRRVKRRPVVSVCVVNWNCRELLSACLRSLRSKRQGVRLEVIVVDNGSTDGAADMVSRQFPEVVLIRNTGNVGFARANNQAARAARGRYLFFLNNDTVVPAGALGRLTAFAAAHPEAGLIGPRLRDGRGRTQASCRQRPTIGSLLHRTWLLRWTGLFRQAYRRTRARDGDFRATRPAEVLMGAALLAPREAFFACGLWDEDFAFGGEDVELCQRVGKRHAVLYHPEVEIIHHGRASSRQHIGYAYANTVTGTTRFLRKAGASPAALLLYKAVFTLDAPAQWLRQMAQYAWRRLRGRPAAAARSLLVARGIAGFLTRGLLAFWRA